MSTSVTFDVPQSIGDDLLTPEEQVEEQAGDTETGPEPEPDPTESAAVVEYSDESSDLLARIWNAEQECRRREARVEMLKEEVKEAKAQLEQSVINLRELCSEQASCGRPQAISAVNHIVEPADAQSSQPAPAVDANGSAWRETPLASILEGIKGLGTKKQEALAELCPTLGAFEDLRATVGRDAAELHELLPRGIGREMASAIEERLLDWISNNTKAGDSDQSIIKNRANELNDGSENCLDFKHPEGNQWYESGWNAHGRQVSLQECPYIPGPEQDDWIRGWLAAQTVENYDQATGEPEEKPQTKELMGISLDDL